MLAQKVTQRGKRKRAIKGTTRKEATIRARVERDLKEDVEKIFRSLGLSTTEAVTLFYRQVQLYNGLPFRLLVPNEKTIEACREAEEGKGLIGGFKSLDDAFDYLGI